VNHESHGNAAHTESDGYFYNVGLWNIDIERDAKLCDKGRPACDPQENLECAIYFYKKSGNNWHHWSSRFGCGC
jgi:hypothetical protein